MSYRRNEPGVLASGAIGALAGVALVGGLLALLALPAQANRAYPTTSAFEHPARAN